MAKPDRDPESGPTPQSRTPHEPGRSRGMPRRPDDRALELRTEQERADTGVTDYDPDNVPPATDTPSRTSTEDTDAYREEKAEIDREVKRGEMKPDQLQARKDRDPYPPTHYDR
ncbi:DEAD/DEAH box helicase [Streptomyces sp. NBC_01754]|uniref:DEAD/DEAH box helicase n=1 Tax=Streptomyces sp. NBC_01754 TaxID=2975930 RepID=UPI002DDB5D45|nr:DEAD/DEAH box helicase [Streptomyces sp. NBC_01754]WSC91272.1 DEAD/DEAH box helicase [Streptomyces sp. NBC_01754]